MRRRLVLAALVAASLGLSVAQAQAHSDPTAVEDLAGHYQGFFQSSVTGEIGTFTLDMTASHNRQLDGVLTSPTLPESLPFHVTVAASGVATAVSPGGDFNFVARLMEEEGIFYFFGHGDLGHKLIVGGTNDVGTLAFIKSFPGDGAAQLPSMLAGSFVRDDGQTGTISVDVCSQTGSDFQGVAMFGDVPFPFLGSIGAMTPPDGTMPASAPVRALSVSPAGTLLITGTWQDAPQPHMDGTVMATFADGSVHTANFELIPAVRPPLTNAN
jgi:hypothetical protein